MQALSTIFPVKLITPSAANAEEEIAAQASAEATRYFSYKSLILFKPLSYMSIYIIYRGVNTTFTAHLYYRCQYIILHAR